MSKSEEANLMPFDPSNGNRNRKVSLVNVARMIKKRIGATSPNKVDYHNILKFAWVPVSKCILNYERQRFPEPKHIKKLHNKWNIMCVTPLQARYSPSEDVFYIADGQQHGIDWVLQYGEDSQVPVCYVESEDENVESIQLLALNTDSEPMAKYFIHKQECIMGDVNAIALEKTVNDSGCETGYKKKSPGIITHITDLWAARDDYGLESLGQVLAKIRNYWPAERIHTANMLGFLKVKELMEFEGVYSDEIFENVFYACSEHFENFERIHLDIKDEFEVKYPTNYKGMGVREKVASGIINVYEKFYNKSLCTKPFDIDMPMMVSRND